MPTEVHDCHQDWIGMEFDNMLAQSFLTAAEKRVLRTRVGTTFEGFYQGPYSLSSMEPDLCLRPDTQAKPTIAIESGWSESWPHLHNDMKVWLTGGAPVVRLVILLRWYKLVGNPKRVRGVVDVFERNAAGIPTLIQNEGHRYDRLREIRIPTFEEERKDLLPDILCALARKSYERYIKAPDIRPI
ncbi:hypothetical protein T310_5726 [Rasamsonia emersonii CBS 393.64]|uniref:Uncharacterized protein n=1 Tax=Rasamsonia emersonii (strain ATCC 16479 / CBS 393.64 / IMI 116815) TaxID=1408163 RepID=A0A0F4YRM4_RASE3|nr:hypothetical protein T310_5726 [Rasamsonia emersonii CBS 393.64]KKA20263.1 hypothetical protein T310_5726 [Rasamsonia emersonii CBS 393.64]